MPYSSISELPISVKNHLPPHAQTIYLEAFNHSWQQYQDPTKRRGHATQEETAHKVAWAAVEKKYHKNAQGQWVKNTP